MNAETLENATESSSSFRHWRAQLDLRFARSAGRTRLAHSRHSGPLRVQRLFYPEQNGKAHCYLLHPPGGVVLGDELQINVTLDSGDVLITTPSAGRFYTVDGHDETQRQSVHLQVGEGLLEWLPQETILFNGVNARLQTRIDLAAGAQLAFWDVVVLGRPACGEVFSEGRLEQSLEVFKDNRPLFCERIAVSAGDAVSQSRMGMQSQSTVGVMLLSASPDGQVLDDWLVDVNGSPNDGPFTVTRRGELLIGRYLGQDAQICREGFTRLWVSVARDCRGSKPALPRIWHT